jgi:hypothetical protein
LRAKLSIAVVEFRALIRPALWLRGSAAGLVPGREEDSTKERSSANPTESSGTHH